MTQENSQQELYSELMESYVGAKKSGRAAIMRKAVLKLDVALSISFLVEAQAVSEQSGAEKAKNAVLAAFSTL